MVEEQRTRVEEAMTNMVNEVDKLHLRKLQVIYLFNSADPSGKNFRAYLICGSIRIIPFNMNKCKFFVNVAGRYASLCSQML